MDKRSHGFGTIQLVMVVAAIAALALVAPPQYRVFKAKTQVADAFSLAGESKQRLSEFYSVNTRLPQTADEAEFAKFLTQPIPEIVRDVVVETSAQTGGVTVKIFLKGGVVENPEDGDQFIFIAGSTNTDSGHSVIWTCGASGVESKLLPEGCRG